MTAQIEQLARALYARFNARDFDALGALLTRDAEWVHTPFGARARGAAGFRRLFEAWAEAMPDVRVELSSVIAGADAAAVEFVFRGTHAGALMAPDGLIAPTHRQVEVRACDLVRFRHASIASVHTYFDAATMLRQLGVIESDWIFEGARGQRPGTQFRDLL